MLIFGSAARPTIFQTAERTQRRKTATLQVRLRVPWCLEAGIVECLKGWRCMVGGVEEYGRRGKVCGGRGVGSEVGGRDEVGGAGEQIGAV